MTDPRTLENQIAGLGSLRDRLSETSFARDHVTRLHSAAKAVYDIATTQTGDDPVRRAQRVSDAGASFLSSIKRSKADLEQRELGGTAALSQAFGERIGMQTDRYANQIIDAFARADQQTKTQMLGQIVDKGDGRSLAALLEAPQFTHNVDREMLSRYMDAAEQKHAPDIAEKRATLAQDVQAAQTAITQAEKIAEAAMQIEDVDSAIAAGKKAKDAEAALATATAE